MVFHALAFTLLFKMLPEKNKSSNITGVQFYRSFVFDTKNFEEGSGAVNFYD
jgi:hypothetical protein